MMKKLIALLLVLLLPTCAFAETYRMDFALASDEDAFSAAFAPLASWLASQPDGDSINTDEVLRMISSLINGFGYSITMQEEIVQVDLKLKNQSFMDVLMHFDQSRMLMTGSVFDGYGLYMPYEQEEITPVFEDKDWGSLLTGVLPALTSFVSTIECTEETGSFSGNAFTGATELTTYIVEDRDVAALLDALLTDEVIEALSPDLSAMGEDPEAIFTAIRERNRQVADANAYTYVIRIATTDSSFVGATVSIMQEDAQLATLSIGAQENAYHLVIGAGRNNDNYWYDITCQTEQAGETLIITGTETVFTAAKESSYPYAVKHAHQTLFDCSFTLSIQHNDDGFNFDYRGVCNTPVDLVLMGFADELQIRATGMWSASAMTGSIYGSLTLGNHEFVRLGISFAPADPLTFSEAGLVLCDMSSVDPDEVEMYNEVIENVGKRVAVRLMKLLPMDKIMSIPKLFNLPE